VTGDDRGSAIRWFEALPPDAPLDRYFDALRDAIRESYLSEPGNPYMESGRGSGAQRGEESRKCIAAAVHRDGSFMDVGCANGLLLESLQRWLAPLSVTIDPHGVDFVPELVGLARERLPHVPAGNFHVANVWDWLPPRRYDFVRTSLDYVPDRMWPDWVTRQWDRLVVPGGRMILCWYYSSSEAGRPQPSPGGVLEALGLTVAGATSALGTEVAWADKTDENPIRGETR
jgi:hypothetical protein